MVVYWEPTDHDNDWNVNNGQKANDGKDYLYINLGVKLVATQLAAEADSFDNKYDKMENVASIDDLKKAISDGAVVIDAQGAEVGMLNYGLTTAMVPAGKTVTIANAKFGPGASYGNKVDGTVIFENCTFDADIYSIHFDGGSGKVVFNNCTLVGWNSFGSVEVEMNNCTIKGNGKYALVRCYKDATLTNCTFDLSNADTTDKYADRIDCGSANPTNTITLIDCANVNGKIEDVCDNNAIEKGGIVIQHDKMETVETGEELKTAIANGETVINAQGANVGNLNYGLTTSTVPAGKTLTIANAKFENNGASYGNKVDGTVVFENCTFDADVYSIHFDGGKGKVVFNNCTLVGWCSFGSVEVEMNNCTIKGNGKYALVRCYKDATLTNCTFDLSNADTTDKYADRIDCGSANPTNTITLVGCTNVNGEMKDICDNKAVSNGNIVIK